jgi:hypothetical protein
MKLMHGAINIYKSGHYHRKGKPGQYDRHPGDIYPTMEAALEDVDPLAKDKDGVSLYVATVPVQWLEPDDALECNPLDSVPTPLSQTKARRALRDLWAEGAPVHDAVYAAPSHIMGMRPGVEYPPNYRPGPGPDRDPQVVIAEYVAEKGYGPRFDSIARSEVQDVQAT